MIYLDNAATTIPDEDVIRDMTDCLRNRFGNPSSLHSQGQVAGEAMTRARAAIAGALNCSPREITFTSGGTESDNQAIRSVAAWGAKNGKKHIVSTAFEHHAVLRVLEELQREGFEIQLLEVTSGHNITTEQVSAALREDTCLVTTMFANNEIGSVLPIAEIGALCRSRGIWFHTDAVQAVGHLPVDVQAQKIDYLSLSAHKFHGPKGVGALYVRRGAPLSSLLLGGAQERGRRAGTENLPAIVGMATALTVSCRDMAAQNRRIIALRDRLIQGLSQIPHSALNGDRTNRLPGNVNFCFEGIEGEALLLLLDQRGICASSGSACASGSLDPSHVLLAIGRPKAAAHGSLRLSLSKHNTEEEIDAVLQIVPEVVARLRAQSPVWKELQEGTRPFLL